MQSGNRYDLTHCHAVITGAAAGFGLAIAKRFAQSGATLSLWDKDGAALQLAKAALGDACLGLSEIDVANEHEVVHACDAAISKAGRIDILVNNAGISGTNGPVWEYPIDEWDRVLNVNLRSMFLCCRAVVPHMLRRDSGRIVNLASVAGKEGNPNASAYSASKGGVIALTKSLGKELAQTPIRVNCVAAGAVQTAIFEQMSQAQIDYMLSKIPINRFGTVDEIAALVAWLASADCSFSTGAVFDISGGRATY